MYVEKFRGIVIKEISFRESDKIITVFAKGIGKVSIMAKGVKKSKTNTLVGASLFSYGDYLTNYKNNFNYIKEVDVIKTFYNLTKNYDNIFIATYFAEHCCKGLMDGEPHDDILLLLINCLNQLDKGVLNNKIVLSIFELKFMQYSGYSPSVDNCNICGDTNKLNYFDGWGTVCEKCKGNSKIKINETVLYTIKYILNNDENIFKFNLKDEFVKQLNDATRILILSNIDYKLKTMSMID